MYVRYGNAIHAANAVAVSIAREVLRTNGGLAYAVKETWTIQGKVYGSTQAELRAAIADVQAAYSVDGGDLVLLHNDLTPSAHGMETSLALGGIKVISGPDFPESAGAEYASYRTFNAVVSGEFPVQDPGLMEYEETLSFSGGGPTYAHLQPVDGLPQKQKIFGNTPYRVTQSGRAVGYSSWPTPPDPLWPADLMMAPQITRSNPQKHVGGTRTNYPVTWSYEFESHNPFVGDPTPEP